jgi:hypothetical protein
LLGAAALPLLIFFGFFAFVYFARWREAVAVRNGFVVAGSPDARIKWFALGDQVVVGTLDGRPFRGKVTQRGHASPESTIIETPIPAGSAPFEMHLSPQNDGDGRLVQRGLEIDVIIGDPVFDPQVVVEAAPQDLARALLDSGLRQAVLAAMPCRLSIADGVVRVCVRSRISHPMRINDLLMLVARTASRFIEVDAALAQHRVDEAPQAGQVYRGMDAEAVRAAMSDPSARNTSELAELRRVRAARRNRLRLIIGGFAVWSFASMSVWTVYAFKRSSSTPPSTKPASTASSKRAYPSSDASAAAAAKRAVAAAHDAAGPPPATHLDSKPALVPKLVDAELTPETFCALQAGIRGIALHTLCSTDEQAHSATRKSMEDSDQDVENCAGALTASLERRHIAFSAAAARACVKATYDLFNADGTKVEARVAKSRDAACEGVLSGKLASGEFCTVDFECEDGLACQGPTSDRRCRGPGKSGDRCGQEIDLLNAGAEPVTFTPPFDTHHHDACGAGLTCPLLEAVCKPLGDEGASCDVISSPCAEDLLCILGKCSRGARHEIGGTCRRAANDCVPGLMCDETTTTCVPTTPHRYLCE